MVFHLLLMSSYRLTLGIPPARPVAGDVVSDKIRKSSGVVSELRQIVVVVTKRALLLRVCPGAHYVLDLKEAMGVDVAEGPGWEWECPPWPFFVWPRVPTSCLPTCIR